MVEDGLMRYEIDVAELSPRAVYGLLTAVVVPRPIAWVATRSADGVDNLAPHSFYTVACADPPIVQFTSVGVKDTLRNVRATREFVVHLAPAASAAQVNATSATYPPGVSEFEEVGIATEPAACVAVARVADSPVAIECRLHSTLELGDSTVVFGRVVHVGVAQAVVPDAPQAGRAPHPDVRLLDPACRLGRQEWGRLGAVEDRPRPR